jgi:hypothetical protein
MLPESAAGWFLAVWTLLVVAALIVGEVWIAHTWTGGSDFGPSSGEIAGFFVVVAVVIWVVGLFLSLVVRRLADRIEARRFEAERSRHA